MTVELRPYSGRRPAYYNALPAPQARSATAHLAARISNALVVCIFLWAAVPEMWTKPILIAEAPVSFYLTVALSISLFVEAMSVRGPQSRFRWAVAAVTLIGVARTFIVADRNHWDFKFFVVDLWNVQSLMAGAMWASRRSAAAISATLTTLAPILAVITPLTCAGVVADIIVPIDGAYADRLYTASLWNIGIICALMWPLLHVSRRRTPGSRLKGRWTMESLGPALAMGCALLVAVFTATRNLLILSVAIYVLARLLRPGRGFLRTLLNTAGLLLLGASIFFVAATVRLKGSSVIDRLAAISFENEQRLNEVRMMFEQLGTDWTLGWGIGSLFNSPVMYRRNPLAVAPHIGIMTPILKGGIIMAGVFVVWPFVMSIAALRRYRAHVWPAATCVFGYMMLASLSGGWYAFELLLLGIGVGSIERNRFVMLRSTAFDGVRRQISDN